MALTVRGRFAPSPTGYLHLGSLTTAVASFCHIKSLGGQWLIRIEDVDFERCKPEYTSAILADLHNLGLHADEPIIYQSHRLPIYEAYINEQLRPFVYDCTCSRKTLARFHHQNPSTSSHAHLYDTTQSLHPPIIYPRLCLKNPPTDLTTAKKRLILPDVLSGFYDGIYGTIWDNPAKSLGDVVIQRQNGMINYILACAIDDGLQNITHLMRGLDILPMTVAQLHILRLCDLPLPQRIYHLPLLHNKDGQKLSKQNLATPINTSTRQNASRLLVTALSLLGQPVSADMIDGTPEEILTFASKHWQNMPLLLQKSLGVATD